MPTKKNKHGLPRRIPADVEKLIRERCGHGCIICGNFFFEYHHFDPEFNDAKVHDPLKIVPLCSKCHKDLHRGIIGNMFFTDATKKPFGVDQGFVRHNKEIYVGNVKLQIGASFFSNDKRENYVLLRIDEKPAIWAEYEDDGSVLLCAHLVFGNGSFIINRNEIIIPNKAFEVYTHKNEVTVKQYNETVLEMMISTDLLLKINYLKYESKGYSILVDGDRIKINRKQTSGTIELNNTIIEQSINLRCADKAIFDPFKPEKYLIKNINGTRNGSIVLNAYLNGSLTKENIIIDKFKFVVGKMVGWKCFNLAGDFIGIYKNGYIVDNDYNYPDGSPKFIRKHNIQGIQDYLYEVSENIL